MCFKNSDIWYHWNWRINVIYRYFLVCLWHKENIIIGHCSIWIIKWSPTGKSEGTIGLHSVSLSASPTVCPSVCLSHTFPDITWLWFQIPGWKLAVSSIWSVTFWCYHVVTCDLFAPSFNDVILVSLQAKTSWRRDWQVPCLADCFVRGKSFTAICTMTYWLSEKNSRRNSDETVFNIACTIIWFWNN